VSVLSAPRINHNGEPISSTRIRECLTQGDVGQANALLGRVYRSGGTITPGKRLGRQLGVPTLNMEWAPDCLPRFGVYAVRVSTKSAGLFEGEGGVPAVANFGLRPTVEQSTAPRLEVHVLGDCAWDAGDELTVEWLAFLRPEQRFSSVDELRIAIGADLAEAKRYFAELQR
jgi:riboflavin kinase / FMN adenylyltransferase